MKKIMFNDRYSLTDAVLSGRKTVTRRLINKAKKYTDLKIYQPSVQMPYGLYGYNDNDGWVFIPEVHYPGEIVAVAQSYRTLGYASDALDRSPKDSRHIRGSLGQSKGWNNKMFVRAETCKHQIKITDIRAERLHDITDDDCLREGIWKADNIGMAGESYWFKGCVNSTHKTPREAFAALIDKISGKGTWESNPFVWRIEFELVK